MIVMSDLKPCPFCGGNKIKKYGGAYSQEAPVTTCTECFTQTLGHSLWNKRPFENKIKADAVQEAIDYADEFAKDQHDWVKRINSFADKLRRGDV